MGEPRVSEAQRKIVEDMARCFVLDVSRGWVQKNDKATLAAAFLDTLAELADARRELAEVRRERDEAWAHRDEALSLLSPEVRAAAEMLVRNADQHPQGCCAQCSEGLAELATARAKITWLEDANAGFRTVAGTEEPNA